jgi:hypothetical protein
MASVTGFLFVGTHTPQKACTFNAGALASGSVFRIGQASGSPWQPMHVDGRQLIILQGSK